jgi:hypothetical protein
MTIPSPPHLYLLRNSAHVLWISHLPANFSGEQFTFFFLWGGTYVTRYCGHFWPIVQPQMIDEGDCGAISGRYTDRAYA